jgi:ParB family chromosome partitioning protein
LLGVTLNNKKKLEPESLTEIYAKKPERVLLCAAYCAKGDSGGAAYYSWKGEHQENESLSMLYDMLIKCGYELSEEEKAMRDGTHELLTPLDVCKNCGLNESEYSRLIGKDNEKCSECASPCDLCKSAHSWCDKCCNECGEETCNGAQRCRMDEEDDGGEPEGEE